MCQVSSYGASDTIKEEVRFCVRWLVTVSVANTNTAEVKFCQVSSYCVSDAMKEEVSFYVRCLVTVSKADTNRAEVRFCVRCLVMVPLL